MRVVVELHCSQKRYGVKQSIQEHSGTGRDGKKNPWDKCPPLEKKTWKITPDPVVAMFPGGERAWGFCPGG